MGWKKLNSRLEIVVARIERAAKDCGREPGDVQLIVVTKGKSAVIIKNLFELGVKNIGESYLNEALFKQDILGDYDIDWHMLGNIQRGKVKQIIFNFNTIHSVDSLSLARELNDKAQQISKKIDVYLEVNVSGESTKQGWIYQKRSDFTDFGREFEDILNLSSLSIKGLMTIAPYSAEPEESRPFFRTLREMRDLLLTEFPGKDISGLSMGMSGDYEIAVQEGATVLRIGTAIVGNR